MSEEKFEEWEKYAMPVITAPTNDGKYEGQIITKDVWVYLP